MKKTFIIDRSKWVSASCGIGDTLMKNEHGFMCCLGQVARQIQPRIRMLSWGCPSELNFKEQNFLAYNGLDSQFSCEAMRINDNIEISQEELERRLTAHFEAAGMELKFKGKAVTKKP